MLGIAKEDKTTGAHGTAADSKGIATDNAIDSAVAAAVDGEQRRFADHVDGGGAQIEVAAQRCRQLGHHQRLTVGRDGAQIVAAAGCGDETAEVDYIAFAKALLEPVNILQGNPHQTGRVIVVELNIDIAQPRLGNIDIDLVVA